MAIILHEHFAVTFFLMEEWMLSNTQKCHYFVRQNIKNFTSSDCFEWAENIFLGQIWFCHRYCHWHLLQAECGSPKFTCYILIPNVMVFGGELFRGWSVMNGISAFLKGNTESSFTLSVTWGHREKVLSMNQNVGTHQTLKLPEIYPELTSLKESEKCGFFCGYL